MYCVYTHKNKWLRDTIYVYTHKYRNKEFCVYVYTHKISAVYTAYKPGVILFPHSCLLRSAFEAPFHKIFEHGGYLNKKVFPAFHIGTLPEVDNGKLGCVDRPSEFLYRACQVSVLAVEKIPLVEAACCLEDIRAQGDKAAGTEAHVRDLGDVPVGKGVFPAPFPEYPPNFSRRPPSI